MSILNLPLTPNMWSEGYTNKLKGFIHTYIQLKILHYAVQHFEQTMAKKMMILKSNS